MKQNRYQKNQLPVRSKFSDKDMDAIILKKLIDLYGISEAKKRLHLTELEFTIMISRLIALRSKQVVFKKE